MVVTLMAHSRCLRRIFGVEAVQQETARLWQLALKKAIAENDPRLAARKIERAEHALFRRIQDFLPGPNALEEQAMFDDLNTIRRLKARWQPPRIARRQPKLESRAMNQVIKAAAKTTSL